VALGIVAGACLVTMTTDATATAELFLAKETFDAGDTGYGLVVSVTGIGMIAGIALVAALVSRMRPLFLYFVSLFVVALSPAGTSVAPVFALAALCVQGFANAVTKVTQDTVLRGCPSPCWDVCSPSTSWRSTWGVLCICSRESWSWMGPDLAPPTSWQEPPPRWWRC
jgi:hypothetical protein